MKRVLLTISYDGTAYHGWQVQPNGLTVQQVMQDGLERLLGSRPALTGCSRTDAGVHARAFCCHLDCDDGIPDNAFLRGLNAILPPDIAVTACRAVPDDFHARYCAKGKNYRYRLYWGCKDPFLSRYALRLDSPPDLGRMQRFCKTLTGTHDFAAFSAAGRSAETTVRTVSLCTVTAEAQTAEFSITADGFLYNMVRIMVGTALAVSDGRLPEDCAASLFQSGDRAEAGETAPPQGLFLNQVFY